MNQFVAYYYTDPATTVTVDFMSAAEDNDGIAVESYEMGVPGIEQARNNSLYSDSPRPVYSKHTTVIDTLVVTVRGSTNTALYTNLHLLAKLGEYARFASQNSADGRPAYLQLKPGGSSAGETLHAQIYDCRVQMTSDWAYSQDASLTIEGVTLTIERGIWRPVPPDKTNVSAANLSLTGQAFASSAVSTADIGGDTSALIRAIVAHDAGVTTGAIDRVILGYRSKLLGGTKYDVCGKVESEAATMGTDTSAVADATASGGNVARCTFGTAADSLRFSGAKIPRGTHRIFARMKITGTVVATVKAKYCDEAVASGGVPVANAPVYVSSTSWLVYDLGIVRAFVQSAPDSNNLGTYQVWAENTGGAGNLDVDWIYIMPTEGYITAQGLGIGTTAPSAAMGLELSNMIEKVFKASVYAGSGLGAITIYPAYTFSLAPMPGPFAFYWLIGTDAGDVFDVGIHASLTLYIATQARYLMPSLV